MDETGGAYGTPGTAPAGTAGGLAERTAGGTAGAAGSAPEPAGRAPGRPPGRTGTAAGTRPGGRRDRRGPGRGTPSAPARPQRSDKPHYWFAERLLAVLSGQRPVHWMLGHTMGEAYEQLVRLAPGAPLRPGERVMPVVRHCGEFRPGPGVIEAFARISAGERVRAMAFRLEQDPDDRRWRCSAVELGGDRAAAP
ncbi:Rv3235 family protein [Streptomyces sp. NPDC017979]|uniref:Rv3235 family protein n=1 Tax=Streptomyces sp. NPDC017979 TaxID=3365024 RepID=UPI003795BA93